MKSSKIFAWADLVFESGVAQKKFSVYISYFEAP